MRESFSGGRGIQAWMAEQFASTTVNDWAELQTETQTGSESELVKGGERSRMGEEKEETEAQFRFGAEQLQAAAL